MTWVSLARFKAWIEPSSVEKAPSCPLDGWCVEAIVEASGRSGENLGVCWAHTVRNSADPNTDGRLIRVDLPHASRLVKV